MAVAGLLLAFASPGRPVHDVVDAGLRGEDERGEEAAGLVARQRDQPTMAGRGSPFSASRPCSVARVTARRTVHAEGTGGFAGAYPWIAKTTGWVNHFYVYAVDADFGTFFVKFCSYFPTTPSCVSTGTSGLNARRRRRAWGSPP